TDASDKTPASVSIGRQPIFDRQRKLWGYELFCVGGQSNIALQIQSSAYVSLQQITDGGKHIMVDFSETSILEDLPYVRPPERAVVRVVESGGRSPSAMESLARLRSDGYLLAVHGFSDADAARLYELADIISMDVEDGEPAAGASRVNATGRGGG